MPQNEKNAKPIGGPGGRGGHGPRPNVKNPGKLFMRLLSYIMKNYAVHCVIVVICIFITVLASVQGTWFMQTLIDGYILPLMKQSDPDFSGLAHAILRVAVFYGIGATTCSPTWKSFPSGILTHTPMETLCQLIPTILIPCAR